MRTNRILLLASLFLFLPAARAPAPIIEESTPQPKAAAKRKAESKSSTAKAAPAETGMNSRSVQVILTENTQSALGYLRGYVQTYESMPFAGKSDVRPDEIVEQLRQALSARFGSVSISNGSSSSRSGGLTMLFDLQAHVGTTSFTKNTVAFIATFKNSAGRTVQTISASGESSIPYPAFGTQFPKAVQRAFADFSQKLSTVR